MDNKSLIAKAIELYKNHNIDLSCKSESTGDNYVPSFDEPISVGLPPDSTLGNFKLSILTKSVNTPLAKWIYQQLSQLEWIDLKFLEFSDMSNLDTAHSITLLEENDADEVVSICNFFREKSFSTTFVAAYEFNLVLGPTYIPKHSAAFDSTLLVLSNTTLGCIPSLDDFINIRTSYFRKESFNETPELWLSFLASLVRELKLIWISDIESTLNLIDMVEIFDFQGKAITPQNRYILPVFENIGKTSLPFENMNFKTVLKKFYHSRSHMLNNLFFKEEVLNDEYKNVAIVGGGTAGYLTALGLKKSFPDLPVSIIESSKVPVIGVGEATTPEIQRFLFEVLEIPYLDFYCKVKPTWKLGIKFFWGMPGDYSFNYPFGLSDIRTAFLHNNDINSCSFTSLLMSSNSSFVVSVEEEDKMSKFLSLSNDISYALHLDNESFIGYLKQRAIDVGVSIIDDLIIDAVQQGNSENVSHVVGESGKIYEYDFFVDCSGFKSLLLEKTLKSEFVSFNSSLFTDMAVTGCLSNNNKIKPYTLAESMDNGWCWNIPMRGQDHRGYVFSSNHCTIDQAADELKRKNPNIENLRTVKFRSGRHVDFFKGNVCAIGNSYAFVEPLESTGIHMIIKEVELLTKNFKKLKNAPALRSALSKNMNGHWDYLRDFLSIHYKYNNKFDTEFWKQCRADTNIDGIKWLIDIYHETGFLSYANIELMDILTKEVKDGIFGLLGIDTLLLGQGVIPRKLNRSLQNTAIWDNNIEAWKALQKITVPLEHDLKILTDYPELIGRSHRSIYAIV